MAYPVDLFETRRYEAYEVALSSGDEDSILEENESLNEAPIPKKTIPEVITEQPTAEPVQIPYFCPIVDTNEFDSIEMKCPYCQQNTETWTVEAYGICNFIVCFFAIPMPLICCIAWCECFMDMNHHCNECNRLIACRDRYHVTRDLVKKILNKEESPTTSEPEVVNSQPAVEIFVVPAQPEDDITHPEVSAPAEKEDDDPPEEEGVVNSPDEPTVIAPTEAAVDALNEQEVQNSN